MMKFEQKLSNLLDQVEKHSLRNESQKFISKDIISKFFDIGLFNVLIPSSLGFGEIQLKDYLKIVSQISSVDASTGWSYMCGTTLNGAAASFLPDNAIESVFKKDNTFHNTIIAGQTSPRATVEIIDGDIHISGQFKFATGGTHANWIICGFHHPDDNQHYLALVPSKNVELSGGWNTIGLSGTGSVDFSIDKLKVSDDFIFRHDSIKPLREKSFFSSGLVSVMLVGHVGVALGLADRAIKEIKKIIFHEKASGALIERQDFQIEFARETSRLSSLNSYFSNALDELEKSRQNDLNQLDSEDNLRLASVFVTEECAKIIRFCYDRAGTHAIHVNSILGKVFRDFHVANQHILIDITQYQKLGLKLLTK